jgi:hypothetical protein
MICQDYTSCYRGIISFTGNTYLGRTCKFVEVYCDDGDECTEDTCIPLRQETRVKPPNCVHYDICEYGYCYWEGWEWDCQYPCIDYTDCGDGGGCYINEECSSSFELQEKETTELPADSELKQTEIEQKTEGLSPVALGGIIGGCFVFVVMVVIVVVIYKKVHQEKIKDVTLQVSLNE